MKFENRVAFITGVSHGIGRAVAIGLAERGCRLALADIDRVGLCETADIAEQIGAVVMKFELDVTDEPAVRAAISETVDNFGKIDILVNNAGIYNTFVNFASSTPDMWLSKIDVNILGTLYPTHAVLPYMLEAGYGRIVNVGSVAGVYGIVNMVDYSMTKGAVIAFTHALAKEVAASGITVNAVSPGSIDVTGGNNPMKEHSFTGRAGTPEECAASIIFLASDDASYVNGQNLITDGCRKKM